MQEAAENLAKKFLEYGTNMAQRGKSARVKKPRFVDNKGSAGVAELVDARDLKSLGAMHRAGSSPASGTNSIGTGCAVARRFLLIKAYTGLCEGYVFVE